MKKRILLAVSILAVVLIAVFLILRIPAGRGGQPVNQTGQNVVVAPQAEGQLIAVAQDADKKGDLLKAKEAYQKLIEKFPASDKISKAQEALENLNVRILLSSIMTGDSVSYIVEKGDNLIKIAKKFNTTPDLIAKVNNIKDSAIRIGKRLKISKAKFSIVIDKSQNILTLKSDQDVLKAYRVSTGKNSCTPVGTFKIMTKIIDPPWYPPTGGVIQPSDPKNVLGSRWLGLSKPSYGIHGTIQPDSIGQSVTEGCVRMKNADVEELYCIVPAGTEVVIVD